MFTSAHVQLLKKNAERVDIQWEKVQSIFSVSQTATRTTPADIYCAMQAVISSFRKIQGIQMQSRFSSSLKTFKNHLVGGISTRIYLIPLSLQHPLGGINTTSKLLCWEHTADFPVLLCIDVDIAICKMSQCLAEISPCAESSKLTLTLQKFYNNPQSKVIQRTSWGITCFFH